MAFSAHISIDVSSSSTYAYSYACPAAARSGTGSNKFSRLSHVSIRYRPPTRTRGVIHMRTLQVISPRRILSRSRFVNTIKRVYVQCALRLAGVANLNGHLISAQPHRRSEEYCRDDQPDPQPRAAQECARRDMCHRPRWEHIVR